MRAADMVVVILDSSTSAEEGGPYVADVTYYGPDGPGSESTGVILCEDTKQFGETVRCYDNTGLMAQVEACDVAEILTLREVRDRILDRFPEAAAERLARKVTEDYNHSHELLDDASTILQSVKRD